MLSEFTCIRILRDDSLDEGSSFFLTTASLQKVGEAVCESPSR